MPSNEKSPEDIRKSDGARWLELIGEGDLIGTPIPYFDRDGRQLTAEEFTLIYDQARFEERVLPFFSRLENMSADDPERSEYIEALRAMLHLYLDKPVGE